MLRLFRFNDPYRLLFVLLVIMLFGIKAELEFPSVTLPELRGLLVGEMISDGKMMYSEVWDSTPPLTAIAQYVMNILFDRNLVPRHIISILIIFLQAAFFGLLLINNKAFDENNYLPSLLFVVLSFFSFDTVSLTREIFGSSLLLLAINNLLKEIEFKKQRDETIHNLGLYLGLASLCVLSYLVFFIGTAILLFIFARVDVRRFGLFVFGFLIPHVMVGTWYFWRGESNLLWTNFYLVTLNFNTLSLISGSSLLMLGLVPLLYLLFSLITIRRGGHLTKYQSQIGQVMFLWLLFGMIEVYFTRLRTPQSVLVCVPPLAYFINHYLLIIKRKAIAEAALWIFILGTVAVNSLSVRNLIDSIDFGALFIREENHPDVKGKKILVLDASYSVYLTNQPAGFFLEWELVRPVFEEPDYYQHVSMVATAFAKDPPEVIFDPNNLMPRMLKYLPGIQAQYRKEGDRFVRIQ